MKAIISTWKTLTDTLSVVGQYSRTWLYPLLSFIIMLLVTFVKPKKETDESAALTASISDSPSN